MSNRLFQSIIHQFHDSINRTIGIIDSNYVVVACSNLDKIGEVRENIQEDLFQASSTFTVNGCTYRSFDYNNEPEYAVFVEGSESEVQRYVGLLSVALGNIKQYYDEKYDRSNFIKNVILDNILPGDIYLKARELRFNIDAHRVCMLIRVTSKSDVSAHDVVQNLFPDKTKDFVISINETDIALVKEVREGINAKDLEKLARSIVDTLTSEFYIHCCIGIGTTITNIKDLGFSFKEAQIAIEVGKVFDTEKIIVSYDHLGVARLIYQLPTTLCEMFLHEIFRDEGSMDALDQETLFTIQRFFENNLNVSETSRKLFVHRNTLVYRLDKIKKLTGLDLREFEDAVVFKVALMVKKYLSSNPIKY